MRVLLAALAVLPLCLACSGEEVATDAGVLDSGGISDQGTPDLGTPDQGSVDLGPSEVGSAIEEEISGFVQPFVDEGWVPGVAIVLIEGEQTSFIGLGGTSVDGPAPTMDTVYEIGSISKTFTGLLLADAVERSEVQLDAPAQSYLPAQVTLPTFGLGQTPILLEQLSTHYSGLPRLPDNLPFTDPMDPYADYTVELMYEFLNGYMLPRAPGALHEYSNLAVGLLGHILAQASSTSYEALLTERVLGPLSLSDTAITLSSDQQMRFATAYDADLEPVLPWDLGALQGAGALRSTPRDMARYARAMMEPPALSAAITLATTPRALVQPGFEMGLGWFILEGGEILLHDGGTGGYRSFLAIVPSEQRAVFAVTNSGTYRLNELGSAALLALRKEPYAQPEPLPVIEVSEMLLSELAGEYDGPVTASITSEGGALYVQLPQQPRFKLYPSSETRFYLRVVEAAVEFRRDAQGQVVDLVLHQDGQQTVFPRR